jgi:D-arabinan exo alpha-(1,3)/(1,5)-arabinofuranosidase (non-reducing end)
LSELFFFIDGKERKKMMSRSSVFSILTTVAISSLFLGAGGLSPVSAAERLTYVDLVNRLTDLEHLATLPAPGEKCAQWSSYDRRSRYDAASGKYVDWSANGDGTGIIRKEGDSEVFAEIKGPAVIWRIWSALAGQGHVKIYLDGNETPAVDLPFDGYFNGKNEPFTRPALVNTMSRGRNCYVPIPFQKSCKIIGQGKWGRYYHFTYTKYPQGTILPTFKRDLSAAESKALDRANEILGQELGHDPAGLRPGQSDRLKTIVLSPGATATVFEFEGMQAVTGIRVAMDLPKSPQDRDVLREIVLQMYWDGQAEPSVWAPLGDFFGTAPGVNKYKSLPLGMTDEGFYCYWYMPFKSGAKIELTNQSDHEYRIAFEVTHAPVTKPIETLGRFHAKWHRDAFLPTEPERRAIDWTMLKTTGRGRFCGVMLHVWNPRGGWWGEGDEKFFVDGEKFPSTIGTGSEDYFGYAWSNPALFSNCYHNQTISMNNRGHISVNRWHITDNVPFQTSFEADIEKYYPNSRPTLYACMAYWYQAAGQTDPYKPVPVEEREGYWSEIKAHKVKGALEGERMKILAKTGGKTQRQDMFGYGPDWSGDAHLWWTDARPGDTLDLAVPVKKPGTYRLTMQLTKAIDYGIVQLYLDGKKLGEPIDLFHNGVVATGALQMGTHELDAGSHVLRVEIVGANEKAVKKYMFGLDYLKLEEVQSSFYLPEDPSYTILDSMRDSARFAEMTLVPYKQYLYCKSSFVDQNGDVMGWHDFGTLEGPGWAANAVGGAYELYMFARHNKDPALAEKAVRLLDHVLEDGFINYQTGFITGYRDTAKNEFCLNYQHKNNWFCPGSMAKVAYQLLIFGDLLDHERKDKMYRAAAKCGMWIDQNVKPTSNGWYPRRCTPTGKHYPKNAYGDRDVLFEKSADGLFIVQLFVGLTNRDLADYRDEIRERVKAFMDAGGIFGSINHDTYDEHEDVAYAVAFRVLREAATLLDDAAIRDFAYNKCLAGLDQFKMAEDHNGVRTKGLLYMEKSWDTAYLWENAEAALAYLEAYNDTHHEPYLADALTILRAIAKHHHGPHGFLTEGVDWNNHVGKQHHFGQAEYGDIKYTEPLLNNLHIVEPTLLALKLKQKASKTGKP